MEAVPPALNPARYAVVALAAVLAAVWPGPRAAATVVVEKDFAALCADADLIFVGTVRAIESQWTDADHRAIETLVTFDDLTWLAGDPHASVTLRFAGGAVDGTVMQVAGVPRFTLGERRVIFAYHGLAVSPIVGFDQGAMRVEERGDGPYVVPTGSSPRAHGSGAAFRLGSPAADAPQPLGEFLDRVRAQLTVPGGRAP